MATIGQFQDNLKNRAKKYLIEHELGKDLIQRIELAGGELKLSNGKKAFEFLNISKDLQTELEEKIPGVQQGLQKWRLD
ncbi:MULTISPECIES: hypothetical protein [Pedobacter]|uniref:hypothetical protein n=1 Tax=Pedobacter TaxID=84567 RepID=UPI000E23709E|nr:MULTISPECIES: hypothetical protein [Pedobacter]AZI27568.1 hypothetical protein EA772_20295 [Pedobacter sp. G11]MDQ1139357.1 hypothetical protein [Pedobacter agri]